MACMLLKDDEVLASGGCRHMSPNAVSWDLKHLVAALFTEIKEPAIIGVVCESFVIEQNNLDEPRRVNTIEEIDALPINVESVFCPHA